MPYLISSIIAIVAALITLMTRYEADDTTIIAESERAKSQFLAIDGFVNTYIQSGGNLTEINFVKLYGNGILLGNMSIGAKNSGNNVEFEASKEMESSLKFPKSNIIWQIVPIVFGDKIKDSAGNNKDISSSIGMGYKLFVNFSNEKVLQSRDAFSENFLGREICEKILFGNFINDVTAINTTNQNLTLGGTNKDGKFACIVFK